jgi:hypothetical protein
MFVLPTCVAWAVIQRIYYIVMILKVFAVKLKNKSAETSYRMAETFMDEFY